MPKWAGPQIFSEDDGEPATKPIRPWADIEAQAEATAALVERLEAEHFCIGCGLEFPDLEELELHEADCF